MEIGLLWYDNRPRDLEVLIAEAVKGYYKRFPGVEPNVCYVHPSTLPEGVAEQQVGAILVRASGKILKYHFWIGHEEQREPEQLALGM
jgi:hypothetical protein